MRSITSGIILSSAILLLSCRELGLPRVATRASSPDGAFTAEVLNRLSIDPPSQFLALRSADGRVILRRLAEDQDWCDTIVWSADSRRVAFLVQGIEVDVYDTSGQAILRTDLDARGGYPPDQVVRSLAFTDDGRELGFEVCERGSSRCEPATSILIPG